MFAPEDTYLLSDFKKYLQEEETKYLNHLVSGLLDPQEYARTVGQVQAIRAARDEFYRLIQKFYADN